MYTSGPWTCLDQNVSSGVACARSAEARQVKRQRAAMDTPIQPKAEGKEIILKYLDKIGGIIIMADGAEPTGLVMESKSQAWHNSLGLGNIGI